MYALGKKPVIVLGTTAMIALGATGISAQARDAAGTTPAQIGKGRGLDDAALAKQLGVSEADLTAALDAVRSELGTGDRAADLAAEAKAIADALDVETSVITDALKAQAANGKPTGDATRPTSPEAENARPTTPPAVGRGRRGGPGGRGDGQDRAALVTAIAKATGKSETAVKAALEAGRTAHEQAETARAAAFAKLLAAELGLDGTKVTAAIDAVKPVRPSRAPKAPAGATS
ncbi:MAG: hypothetical protein PGN13_02190 [Patulibacter minatonensis]